MFKINTIIILILSFIVSQVNGQVTYYVSDKTGSDTNSGTIDMPFKTVQKAANVMFAGDICYIGQGIYHELVTVPRSGTASEPISFYAYPGQTPVVSGADVLDVTWSPYNSRKGILWGADVFNVNYTTHSGNIYKASVSWQFNQLFVDGEMMNEARWPNTTVNNLVTMPRATCDSGTNASTLVDAQLPAGNWNGASVHIVPGAEWIGWCKKITNYMPGKSFTFGDTDWPKSTYYIPKAGNPYWIFGSLDGLDIATEWFLDKRTHTVYLWCPGNPDPAKHRVEAKKRDYAFDLSGQKYIQIKGLRIFATSPANTKNASDCLIEDCHVKYIEHFNDPNGFDDAKLTNKISGTNITFRKCSIAYSAGNGLYNDGTNNKIINCIIHDVCYLAGYHAMITDRGTAGEYRQNTLYNSGRYLFLHWGTQFKFLNNDLFNGGILTNDIGLTYTYGTDGQGSVIAYNKVHDNKASIGVGIYLDNYAKNYVVHHNLVWGLKSTAIRLNCPSLNNLIYNNTALSTCKNAFNYYTPSGVAADQRGTKVINNLYQCLVGRFVTGSLAPQVDHNGNYPIGSNNWPSAGSGAIDAGAVIDGITDGYVGAAPDIGCFETGTNGWTAGADWTEIPW